MLYTSSKIHFIFQIPENPIKNTSQSWWWLFFAVQHLLIFLASIKSKKSLYKTIYLCVYVSHQYDFFIKKCVLLVTLLTGFCLQAKQSFTRSEVVVCSRTCTSSIGTIQRATDFSRLMSLQRNTKR